MEAYHMAANTVPSHWDDYEYDIQITFANNGKIYKLKPVQIHEIIIEKDFDNQFLPILILKVSKQESIDVSMDNNTEIIISIDRFIVKKNKSNSTQRKVNKRNIIRDIFCLIDPDVTPSEGSLRQLSQKEKRVKKNEITPEDLASVSTYTLFRKSDLIASKFIYNAILSKVSMQQAITTLLSQSGISKVLMSNLDFTETIDELLLLPVGLITQLKYLKNYYGWHEEDTIIFMDIDCMYLIRMSGKCTAWRKGESKTITFYINTMDSTDNFNGGMSVSGNNLYVNASADNYVYQDRTGIDEQLIGTNTMLFNEDTASVSTIQGTTTNTISSTGTTNVKTSSGHNKYLENWIKCRDFEQSGVVAITCNNIDFSQLTPNKEYRLVSKKMSTIKVVQGTYRLTKTTTAFAKNGNNFIEKTTLELRKTD